MENRLDCEVVQDLLPSYIDGLTSEVTNLQVEMHLEDCVECTGILNRMKEDETASVGEENEKQQGEIDYFKLTKKRSSRKVVISVIATIVMLAVAGYIYLYEIAHPLDLDTMDVQVVVNGKNLKIEGTVVDDIHSVTGMSLVEADGIVVVEVNGTYKNPFFGNEILEEFELSRELHQVWIGDDIVWEEEDGTQISKLVSNLYQAKNPYVGNVTADCNILEYMNVSDVLGRYELSLNTDEKPYGCEITLLESISCDKQGPAELKMQSYLCVMLALIDNMGTATFHYNVDGEEMSLTVTEEYATELVWKDIKACAESPIALMELMSCVNLTDDLNSYYEEIGSDAVRIMVTSSLPIDVDLVVVELYDGEECLYDAGIGVYDTILRGKKFPFDITESELEGSVSENMFVKVSFHCDELGPESINMEPMPIVWKTGTEYRFVISENQMEGYNIDIEE